VREEMARRAMIEKAGRAPKFKVRAKKRCIICGRPRGFMGKFQMCRICFRMYALKGEIPGVIKSSW
jgi:small subunit ribosomal protein S14